MLRSISRGSLQALAYCHEQVRDLSSTAAALVAMRTADAACGCMGKHRLALPAFVLLAEAAVSPFAAAIAACHQSQTPMQTQTLGIECPRAGGGARRAGLRLGHAEHI